MAQPQQSYQMPPRPFSPPDQSASPAAQQPFGLPPNKRQRLEFSPNPPSQPGSPYLQSPYAMSPGSTTTPSAGASPHFTNVALPQGVYNTPYTNGHSTSNTNTASGLSLPQSQQNQQAFAHTQSPLSFPGNNSMQMNPHVQGTQQAPYQNFSMAPLGQGTMGPPLKPPEKPKQDGQNDVMDVLGGTGIDLAHEEDFAFRELNNTSQLSAPESGTISSGRSFSQFPPGDAASFFGAGPANAAAEVPEPLSQEEYHKKRADDAWRSAAANLAFSRQRELNSPFLQVGLVHARMQKIARDNGLELHESQNGQMGTMKLPEQFTNRDVQVNTVIGPNGAFTTTSGNFLPVDSMAVDQLALLSIATKRRLENLIEDAYRLAKGRRTDSHGIIPGEWVDVAAPNDIATSNLVPDGAPRSGWESALSPHSDSRKRSFSVANQTPASAKTSSSKYTNEVLKALQLSARKERDFEESRLRKRNARNSGETSTPRAGSVVPGTPGSVAPDYAEKAPTKKEAKKKAEAKVNEAASHAAANQTTAAFLGGGGGLFGKKKGKNYSWMTATPGGSGASTPGRIVTQGLPGTPSASAGPVALTQEGSRRIGGWREHGDKGRGMQMRDWIAVLEDDGHEKKALQKAYMNLDQSDPK